MPFINIRIAPGDISKEQAKELIERTTALMRDVMKKKPERTTIHIQPEDPALWSSGGKRIADQTGSAVLMDIKVTEGTNMAIDKVAMVEASQRMLSEVVGAIPAATYVIIDEISGESWGKAGAMMYETAAADRKAALAQAVAAE